MKKRWVLAGVLTSVLLTGGAALALKSGDKITVRAMSAKVMSQPKFLGASTDSVRRGDALTFVEAQKDWYKVKTAAGKEGWINKQNVVDKVVKLSSQPGNSSGGANKDEIELAGRGFSPEVEEDYKGKHPDLDYSHVNAIEQLSLAPEDVEKFRTDGKLGGGR